MKNELPPKKGNGREYCWPQVSERLVKAFELLPCESSQEESAGLSKAVAQGMELPAIIRYERVMEEWEGRFLRFLDSPSNHESQQPGVYFLGLQRWNSSSPAEPNRKASSLPPAVEKASTRSKCLARW